LTKGLSSSHKKETPRDRSPQGNLYSWLKWVGLYPIQLVDDDRVGLGLDAVHVLDVDGVLQLGVGGVLNELLCLLLGVEVLDTPVVLDYWSWSLLDNLGSRCLG